MIPAPELEPSAIVPIALLSGGAFLVLLGEIALTGRRSVLGRTVTNEWIGSLLAGLSALVLAVVAVVSFQGFLAGGASAFNLDHPMLRLDRFANFTTAVLAVAGLLSCLISVTYLAELRIQHGEYYALLLIALAGMALLVSAVDLITVFLGIEILSIPIYVLAGFDRRRLRSNESALKYFLVGSFASGLLLYGMALVYGATGSTSFEGIAAGFRTDDALGMVGLGLVVVGFTFKVSSVPFHQWTPDVYEGSPTSVTAFMAVTVKVAAFAALLRLLAGPFAAAGESLNAVLWVIAALTMVVGNVMAVVQDNLKRLLAYSSIAHGGYVLVGFTAGTPEAYGAVVFYLIAYVFMNLGAFAVIVALANRGKDADRIEDLRGLAQSRPGLAALMTVFMVSLIGIPGTVGFIGKFVVFSAAVQAGYVGLAILAVLASLVSVYYYLRIPVAMYMTEPGDERPRTALSSGEWLVLAVCTVMVLGLGLFPNEVPIAALDWLRTLDWSREAVAILAAGG